MDASARDFGGRTRSAPVGDIVFGPAREPLASVVAPRRLKDAVAKESDGIPMREAIDRHAIRLFASREVAFDEGEPRAELHVIGGNDRHAVTPERVPQCDQILPPAERHAYLALAKEREDIGVNRCE